jgi:hypothetical protein
MTDILLDNIKLVALFVLIATVIGQSHFGRATPSHSKVRRKYGKSTPIGL